jgi:hypothetical protein
VSAITADFWLSSGFHLLDHTATGGLAVTDDFLRAYLARPEISPLEMSCPEEIALHRDLMADPRRAIDLDRLDRLTDSDARENYALWLGFRDRLLDSPTLEAGYLGLFSGGAGLIPPLFIDQLVHVLLRHLLDGCTDAQMLRAAELLFRIQRVSIRDGAVMLADEETVELNAHSGGLDTVGRLLAGCGVQRPSVELDVLNADNAHTYWARSDRFDMVFDASFGHPGLDALCRVMELWVGHFLAITVHIEPVRRIEDDCWHWHIGLDAEATRILNALYNGETVGEARLAQVLALFRLEFLDTGAQASAVRGHPVHLAMAMTPDNRLRLKPQNLLMNLPLDRIVGDI